MKSKDIYDNRYHLKDGDYYRIRGSEGNNKYSREFIAQIIVPTYINISVFKPCTGQVCKIEMYILMDSGISETRNVRSLVGNTIDLSAFSDYWDFELLDNID